LRPGAVTRTTPASVLSAEFGTVTNDVEPGVCHCNVSCWPPPASKKSM
jgi:hypothetical protein